MLFTSILSLAGRRLLTRAIDAGGAPVSRTFIPRLLPKEQLAAGLALRQIGFQAAMLVGPALGGLVLGWLGVGGCYLIDAITFGLAFYGAFGLPPAAAELAASAAVATASAHAAARREYGRLILVSPLLCGRCEGSRPKRVTA